MIRTCYQCGRALSDSLDCPRHGDQGRWAVMLDGVRVAEGHVNGPPTHLTPLLATLLVALRARVDPPELSPYRVAHRRGHRPAA